jgi:hypothetical protein
MNKLAIIVPYRDREEHLKKFIPHISQFLKDKIDFKIFIIEQNNNKIFNRGILKNIGFLLAEKKFDYFCFHDVDHIPVSSACDYSPTKAVAKLATYVSQFNFIKRPVNELAGVIIFEKNCFKFINGYSNEYWGWGIEDDDLGQRCIKKNIFIESREGRYISLPHKTEGDTSGGHASEETIKNRILFSEIKNDINKLYLSGLSNINFIINSISEKELYTHVKVDF